MRGGATDSREKKTMMVSGTDFCRVANVREVAISRNALADIEAQTGFRPTAGLAGVLLRRARRVEASDGWRLCFTLFGEDFWAILEKGAAEGAYVWRSTQGEAAYAAQGCKQDRALAVA